MKKILSVFLAFALAFVFSACGSSSAPEESPFPFKMNFGEILDYNVNDNGTLIVKAKIKSNLTKEMTIKQNYMNAWEIIQSAEDLSFSKLQYWAVADMTDGSESKVIQFTVPESAIDRVRSGSILENGLGDYVEDLWIHPSLK